MEDRTAVLATSLAIENFTSLFLGILLGIDIKAQKEAKSLKMGVLSFSQKVDLLIDMRALQGRDRTTLQLFMEMRNLFMHDFFAHTYFICYELFQPTSRNGLRNKYYPNHPKTAKLTPNEAKTPMSSYRRVLLIS